MKNIFLFILLTFLYSLNSLADDNKILIQSTTSTRDSGFYEYILPYFYKEHNISVSVVSVGTGQAIKNASRCDGDLLIVHSPKLEEKFMSSGFGLKRNNLMYNNFIIIGPKNDPVKISSSTSILDVFSKLYASKFKFISRADDSGTHSKEKSIWELLGLESSDFDQNFEKSWPRARREGALDGSPAGRRNSQRRSELASRRESSRGQPAPTRAAGHQASS